MSHMMMKCNICGKQYPMEDPIRRTCGGHSEPSAMENTISGRKFIETIRRNFQNPNYQNYSLGLFTELDERNYHEIWWGF